MKSIKLITLIIISLIISCKKKDSNSTICFELNEKKYEKPLIIERTNNTYSLIMSNRTDFAIPESQFENLTLTSLQLNMEKHFFTPYKLIGGNSTFSYCRFFNTQIGGDNACEVFTNDSLEKDLNFLQITKHNADFTEFEGKFNFKLYKVDDCNERNYDSVLNFSSGTFTVCP